MKSLSPIAVLPLLTVILFASGIQLEAQGFATEDAGYIFTGPREELKSKQIKPDLFIQAFMQRGVIITENPDSPWHNATLFAHGSVLKDLEGNILKEVVFYEAADADGNLTWTVLYYPEPDQPGTFEIIDGIGKWAGIDGVGVTRGMYKQRTDDHFMLKSELVWNIEKAD